MGNGKTYDMRDTSYDTVLLDWDDTLWDFRNNSCRALRETYERYELKRYFGAFEQFHALYAYRNKELWAAYAANKIDKVTLKRERFLKVFQAVGVNDTTLAERVGDDYLMGTVHQTGLIDGAREVLMYLADKGYTLTVLSNGFTEVQYEKIEASGLRPYIDHIVLSEEVGLQKPDPAIFHRALQVSDSVSDRSIMIGDNVDTDICGAQRVNIDTVWLAPCTAIGEPCPYQPTYVVKSLRDIKSIL